MRAADWGAMGFGRSGAGVCRFVREAEAMAVLFIEYPKCSTCKKAKKWLEGRGIAFEERDIVAQNPTADELRTWRERSGLPLRRFFNTSGMLYRELGVKQRLDEGMSDDEAYALLASDGMLVKRPLLIVDGMPATPGFHEADWVEALGGNHAAPASGAAS